MRVLGKGALGVCGSRTAGPEEHRKLLEWITKVNPLYVVSGGCRGPDTWAADWAREHLPEENLVEFKPDWERFGKRAAFIRNSDIVNHSDMIIAVWDQNSNGTKDTIKKALEKGKPVLVLSFVARKKPL